MKKLLSTKYKAGAFNTAMFILRIVTGVLLMMHGYEKLVKFGSLRHSFMNFLGMGSSTTLALVIFAEFFCGLFIAIGLFTRLSAIAPIIMMIVIVFQVKKADVFGAAELPALYLAALLCILLVGPGKASIDGVMGK